jgi:hypothetical protein
MSNFNTSDSMTAVDISIGSFSSLESLKSEKRENREMTYFIVRIRVLF